ncbi:Cloroperoxidase [Coprinopsis marcescibilis]|uniref:Cloroperoxidase n=1 Tax=Coprinopsis marcescibilis TaxID=230819 RepID=A0A5C3KDX7_COPMA|nr:Cloroperoxidase [Coprinopsis marcescibilis]
MRSKLPISSLVAGWILFPLPYALAFPSYASLRGLSARQEEPVEAQGGKVPPNPPGPPSFTGTKLVDDSDHPWQAPQSGDIRGPCPGLNTLASHGYLPRNGVASPSQIITAVQEGFNMDNAAARGATYTAHLLVGNVVADLLSIGGKTPLTGRDFPGENATGISEHGRFEGDASLTRVDDFHGDRIAFDQGLFDQASTFFNRFGNGFYNITVAAELRFHRIQQSISTNPEFNLMGLRHISAYGEAALPVNLFVDGRKTGAEKGQLDMDSALSFFKDFRFPSGFFRAAEPGGAQGADVIVTTHPVSPGRNEGAGNYVVDDSLGSVLDPCKFYTQFVNVTVRDLYPNPRGVLRRNLNLNLGFVYEALGDPSCPQVFPYGQD